MTQAASRLKVKDQDGVTIVEFLDKNILDEFAIQQITEEMTRLVDVENRTQMIINLVNVEHLSSAALGTLITINKTNFVVASVLARDSKRNIDFDFSLHQNFPTAKLV